MLPSYALSQSNDVGGQTETRLIGKSIPDPESLLQIAAFAANPTVAEELKLTKDQLRAIKSMLKQANGALAVVLYEPTTTPDGNKPSSLEISQAIRETRRKREKDLEEILRPDQRMRLKEIAYQIEVYRVGIGAAITEGRLAEDVGVTENQKTALRKKCNAIEERVQKEISEILLKAQEELLRELSAEQREKAKSLLGHPFYFRDDDYRLRDQRRFAE